MSFRDDTSSCYLCESGEVRERADKHRAAHIRLYGELFDFVHSLGAKKADIDYTMMKLRGIEFPSNPPEGWTKPDKRGLSRPLRRLKNTDSLKYFTPGGCFQVKRHPDLQEFFTWLKCPISYEYSYKSENGTCTGWSMMGESLTPVGLYWYSQTGPILLVTPNMRAAKAYADKNNQKYSASAFSWRPPKGCKKIMIEEWNLMQAKYQTKKKDA